MLIFRGVSLSSTILLHILIWMNQKIAIFFRVSFCSLDIFGLPVVASIPGGPSWDMMLIWAAKPWTKSMATWAEDQLLVS